MSHFECSLNWCCWRSKKVVQVVQIGGRGGEVIWTKSKRTATFLSWNLPQYSDLELKNSSIIVACYFCTLGGLHGDSGDHILLHLRSYHRQYTVVTSSILTSFCNHFLCDAFVILLCNCFCNFAYFYHINSPSFYLTIYSILMQHHLISLFPIKYVFFLHLNLFFCIDLKLYFSPCFEFDLAIKTNIIIASLFSFITNWRFNTSYCHFPLPMSKSL